MFIKGNPSTGKTTLLASIAYNFFGEDNIGNVTNSESFNLEDLLEKEIAILDEAEHMKINMGHLLKMTDKNNPQKIDRKYKTSATLKNVILLILSNNDFKIKDPLVNIAFLKRVKRFEFKKELPTDIYLFNELQRTLKRDEINIIVYCNKKFFKKFVYDDCEKNKKIKTNMKEKILKLLNK
jgi:phage/plasmid-associated DNA primase